MTIDKVLRVTRGDTLSFNAEIDGLGGLRLSGASFAVKTSFSAAEAVFRKTLHEGITQTQPGVWCVRATPADTALLLPGTYVYDLKNSVNGDKFTVMKGDLIVENEVE